MKAKIMNGDHYQYLQDKEAGESKAEEAKETPAQEAAEDRMPPRMKAKTSKAKKGAGLNSVMKD